MGHKNKVSLVKQVQDVLDSKLCIGESKQQAKIMGIAQDGIYSWGTYKSYIKHLCYFVDYCKNEHRCKTIDQCRQYADEWLASRKSLSPYTQKMERSALCKLYGCRSTDFKVEIDARTYDKVSRSRGEAVRDKHFSVTNNADLVEFASSTGLRRAELEALRGTDLVLTRYGQWMINITRGSKGGRNRIVPIIGNTNLVVRIMQAAGNNKVFHAVPSAMDVHSYRAVYAQRLYNRLARPLDICRADRTFKQPGKEFCDYDAVYWRRGAHKGEWMDKRAMLMVSRALGHNRISVAGEHYLFDK